MKLHIRHLVGLQVALAIAIATGNVVGNLEGFVVFGVAVFLMLASETFRNKSDAKSLVVRLGRAAAFSISVTTALGVAFATVLAMLTPDASSFSPFVSGVLAFMNIGSYTSAWVISVGILMFFVALVLRSNNDKSKQSRGSNHW